MFGFLDKIMSFIGIVNVNMMCDFIYYQEEETTEDEKNEPCQIIFNPESADKNALRQNLSYLNYFEADFNKPAPVKKRELSPDFILDPLVSFKADILSEICEWQKRLLLEKLRNPDIQKLLKQNGNVTWVNQDFYLINLFACLPDALLQRILDFDKAQFAKLQAGAVSAKTNSVVEPDSLEEAFETEVVDCLVAAIEACSDEKDPTVKGIQCYQSKASLPNKLFSSQAALTQVLKPVFDKFEEMVPVKRKGLSPTP